jgi:Zn-dependent protease
LGREIKGMLGTFRLGTWLGIQVKIHWSFWILVLVVLMQTGGENTVGVLAFLAAIFSFVLLHEFGHALAARRFGIQTRDITLLPIGGLARLERMPTNPRQELIIALAGPAVNVVLAIALGLMILAQRSLSSLWPADGGNSTMLQQLMLVNIVLVVFNMLPAFPMDGGRVLRSLLAWQIGYLPATIWAVRVGRWMALMMFIASFFWVWTLALIAAFIWLAGTAELVEARRRSMTSPMWTNLFWGDFQPPSQRWFEVPPGDPPGRTRPGRVIDTDDFRRLDDTK